MRHTKSGSHRQKKINEHREKTAYRDTEGQRVNTHRYTYSQTQTHKVRERHNHRKIHYTSRGKHRDNRQRVTQRYKDMQREMKDKK